ncbi:MAG: alpha/beta hydrolase-fold protein, partial [Bdellovibrionales bacterium]|nr:alpha/beta hydrolase-fold protein [Bdellovibrionales bacterium]
MHHGKVLLLLLVLSTSLFAKDFQGPIREDFDDLGLHDDVLIYLPSDYNELKSYPLILSLHGLGASAYIQNITFNFKEFITQKQFILVVPEGMVGMGGLHYWNATDFCCGSRQRTKVDDVEYLSSVIEKMISNYSVNPKEVHLFGHSNGGFMANRLACDVPHLFKSFASFAGTTWLDPSKCKSSSALSMLHIHGNIDNIVVYDGIEGSYPGALETTQRWVKRN